MSTGGEGGMLTTNDKTIWEKAWSFKDHGKSYGAVFERSNADTPFAFRWLHESIGTNWRITEMQAAIGRAHLAKLDGWVAKRQKNAKRLAEAFRDLSGVYTPAPPKHIGHAFYKYYLRLDPKRLRDGWSQSRMIDAINAEGVPCLAGACPEVYLEKAFTGTASVPDSPLPIAHRLRDRTMMLQVHPTLLDADLDDVATAVKKVIEASMA